VPGVREFPCPPPRAYVLKLDQNIFAAVPVPSISRKITMKLATSIKISTKSPRLVEDFGTDQKMA
jgi:hypothetical protein